MEVRIGKQAAVVPFPMFSILVALKRCQTPAYLERSVKTDLIHNVSQKGRSSQLHGKSLGNVKDTTSPP